MIRRSLAILCACALAASGQTTVALFDTHTHCLLGGWDGKKWVSKMAGLGARKYRVQLAGGEFDAAEWDGGEPKPIDGPCGDSLDVPFERDLPEGSIAVTAGSAAPAPPVAFESMATNSRVYISAFRTLLDSKGVRSAVKIDQLLRVDLDGDGKQEVLASLYNVQEEGAPSSKAGDYSAIVLRRVSEQGQVTTQVVDFESHPRKDGLTKMSIGPLVSLKGDGKVQVLIRGAYSKGTYSHLYEMKQGKLVRVLECSCGG